MSECPLCTPLTVGPCIHRPSDGSDYYRLAESKFQVDQKVISLTQELHEVKARAEAAEAKLAEIKRAAENWTGNEPSVSVLWRAIDAAPVVEKVCRWSNDDPEPESWSAECRAEWNFHEGTPTECGVKFCPNCGGKVEVGD